MSFCKVWPGLALRSFAAALRKGLRIYNSMGPMGSLASGTVDSLYGRTSGQRVKPERIRRQCSLRQLTERTKPPKAAKEAETPGPKGNRCKISSPALKEFASSQGPFFSSQEVPSASACKVISMPPYCMICGRHLKALPSLTVN